jgi:hypothetical protein
VLKSQTLHRFTPLLGITALLLLSSCGQQAAVAPVITENTSPAIESYPEPSSLEPVQDVFSTLAIAPSQVATVRVLPDNAVLRAGETVSLELAAFDAAGKYLGSLAEKEVDIKNTNTAFAKQWKSGKLLVTASSAAGKTTLEIKLKNATVTTESFVESVPLKSAVVTLGDQDVFFPRSDIKGETLTKDGVLKLTAGFDTNKVFDLVTVDEKKYIYFPVILSKTAASKLKVDSLVFAGGGAGFFGRVVKIVEIKNNRTLLQVRIDNPNLFTNQSNNLDLAPIIRDLFPNSNSASSLSSQNILNSNALSAKYKTGPFECEISASVVRPYFNTNFNVNSFNVGFNGIDYDANFKMGVGVDFGGKGKVGCKAMFDVTSTKFGLLMKRSVSGIIGLLLTPTVKAGGSLDGTLDASDALGANLGANFELNLTSNKPNTSSFKPGVKYFSPTDFWNVTGSQGFIKANYTGSATAEISVSVGGEVINLITQCLNLIGRTHTPTSGDLAVIALSIGPTYGSELKVYSMRSIFDGQGSKQPTYSEGLGFKVELKLSGWVGDELKKIGIVPEVKGEALWNFSQNKLPKAKTFDLLDDDGEGSANTSITWDNFDADSAQLGWNPANSLHGKQLASSGGPLTYDATECKKGPVKGQLLGVGTLEATADLLGQFGGRPPEIIKIPNLPFWDGTEVEVCDPYEVTPPFLSKILEIYDKDSVFFSIKRLGKAIKPVEFSITPAQVLPWLEKVFPAPAIVKPLEDKKIEVGLYCPNAPKSYSQELLVKRANSTTDPGKKVNVKLECYQDDYDATAPAPMVGAVNTPVSTNFDVKYLGNNNVTTIKQMNLTIKDIGTHPDWTLAISPSSPTLLKPGDVQKIQLSTVCPSTPRREHTTLEIQNTRTKYKKTVTVELVCDDGPVLEVTQPDDMSTYVNATTTSDFDVKNLGIGALNYTITDPTDPIHFAITPQSGTVAGSSSNKATVIGTCGSTPAVYTSEATVRDTVLGKTAKVNLKLECKPSFGYEVGFRGVYAGLGGSGDPGSGCRIWLRIGTYYSITSVDDIQEERQEKWNLPEGTCLQVLPVSKEALYAQYLAWATDSSRVARAASKLNTWLSSLGSTDRYSTSDFYISFVALPDFNPYQFYGSSYYLKKIQ